MPALGCLFMDISLPPSFIAYGGLGIKLSIKGKVHLQVQGGHANGDDAHNIPIQVG